MLICACMYIHIYTYCVCIHTHVDTDRGPLIWDFLTHSHPAVEPFEIWTCWFKSGPGFTVEFMVSDLTLRVQRAQ